jgi:hypothetical protein
MRSERLAAATGLAYVTAVAVGDPLATSTSSGTPLEQLREGRTVVEATGVVLELVAFGFLLLFLGYLYRVLHRAEGPGGWAAGAALGAGLVATAVKLGSAAPVVAAVYRADVLTPDLARTLDDLNGGAFVVSGYPFGVFVALAAGSAFVSRALPRWLTAGGLVAGAVTVVAGIAGVLDPGAYLPVPFLLSLLWVLLASAVLTVRGRRPGTAARARAREAVGAEPTATA